MTRRSTARSRPDAVGARVRAALGGVVRDVRRAGPPPARQRLDAGRRGAGPDHLAALVVAPFGIAALRGRWDVLRAGWRTVLVYGLVAVAATQFFYFSAVSHMEVAPALLIEYTAPAAIVVWLWLRHGERPGRGHPGRRRAGRRWAWCWCSTCSRGPTSASGRRAVVAGRDGRVRDLLRDVGRRGQRACRRSPWPPRGLVVGAAVARPARPGRAARPGDARRRSVTLRGRIGRLVGPRPAARRRDGRRRLRLRASPPSGGWARGWRRSSRWSRWCSA